MHRLWKDTFNKQHNHINDVNNHPNFTNMKQLMSKYNLKICSSYPIISKNNEVLGTLSFYFNEPISLTKNQEDTIAIFLPYITSILAHTKQDQALTTVNQHYLQSQQASQTGSWEWNLLDNSVWWSDQTYSLFEVDQQSFKVSFESFLTLLTAESSNQASKKAETNT